MKRRRKETAPLPSAYSGASTLDTRPDVAVPPPKMHKSDQIAAKGENDFNVWTCKTTFFFSEQPGPGYSPLHPVLISFRSIFISATIASNSFEASAVLTL